MIDLLLVNPSNTKEAYGILGESLSAIEPPLWTGLLAGFIRAKGFSVNIIDADAEGLSPEKTAEKILGLAPSLVGISTIGSNPSASSTPKMAAAHTILNTLKNKNFSGKTFLYGIHPSALPAETLAEEAVDFICRGECFYTVHALLTQLRSHPSGEDFPINGLWYTRNNELHEHGWGTLVENIDDLPMVAWDLLPMEKYRAHNWHCFGRLKERKPYAAMYTSLGCPFYCTYCNIHALYNGQAGIRFRSTEKVIAEIDFLVNTFHIKNIKILDELFVLNKNRVHELCDLIIQKGYELNIWAYARVDTVDRSLLQKMKQAGITWLCYGIESGSKVVRDSVMKMQYDNESIKNAIAMTHDAGIHVIGNFIFGLPEDNLATMRATLDLAQELRCEYVNFYTAMAYPGSQLYSALHEKGIAVSHDWFSFSQLSEETTPLATQYISNVDVLHFRDYAFHEYYSTPLYLSMIKSKFGPETVAHIHHMLTHKIKRQVLTEKKKAYTV